MMYPKSMLMLTFPKDHKGDKYIKERLYFCQTFEVILYCNIVNLQALHTCLIEAFAICLTASAAFQSPRVERILDKI